MKPTTATAGIARKETCKILSVNPANPAAEAHPQRRIAIAGSRQWTRYTESRFKQFASGR